MDIGELVLDLAAVGRGRLGTSDLVTRDRFGVVAVSCVQIPDALIGGPTGRHSWWRGLRVAALDGTGKGDGLRERRHSELAVEDPFALVELAQRRDAIAGTRVN